MRITIKKHWDHLFHLVLITFGVLIAMWFLEGRSLDYIGFIVYLASILILAVIPTIVVHTNYFFKNRNSDLVVTKSELHITIREKKYKIRPNDTLKVEYVLSPEMFGNRTVWLPWNYYRHVIIHMRDGNKFTITSLLTDDFSWLFDLDFDYETKVNLYRLA